MDTAARAIYQHLIEVAMSQRTVSYEGAGAPAGLGPRSPVLYGILDRINMEEHHAGRPLLSAVVINSSGRPGDGFFQLATYLGHFREDDDKAQYWAWELHRVHEEWARA